eukprot:TRINITY_DN20101_c0_g1_i1.p1 TRINITY_DN20101_c0_g1~~TRINITY_DN20101_c0_g1_i1.p1  ORF type:complete len:102 (-),score=27.75 TRINITY_DN20101_c0_g1_i1:72-377(-)
MSIDCAYYYIFFFEGYGDHRDLHYPLRRQRQMCIRDSSNTALLLVRSLNAIGSEAELTVAMSIHQPRIEIWEELDEVLFLAPGGKTVYHCLLYTSPSPRDS